MEFFAVLYARVSSAEQSLGYSTDAQIKLLHEYANKCGYTIKKEFIEAKSAKKAGRTQFGEMLKFATTNNKIKHILVEKTDRLSRNFSDCVDINNLIENHNALIHFVKEGSILHKDSNSQTKLMYGIRAVIAKKLYR